MSFPIDSLSTNLLLVTDKAYGSSRKKRFIYNTLHHGENRYCSN